jgi:thioredoxin 1
MSDKVIHVNDSNFDETMSNSSNPVMVDFWAPWCGPCRMLGPILDNMAEKYSDKITFVKVNVDECPTIATKYQISGIPNMKIFKD